MSYDVTKKGFSQKPFSLNLQQLRLHRPALDKSDFESRKIGVKRTCSVPSRNANKVGYLKRSS